MSTHVPAEPRRSPPSWMIPAGIGMIIVLLAVLIVVLLTRDDGGNSSPPATTVAAVTTAASTLPVTTVAEPAPPETVATSTVPATEPATTESAPQPITSGQAALVIDGKTQRFSIAATCSDFWAGVQTTSHVLIDNDTKHIWVVDVLQSEEGGDRGMRAVDMDFAIAANVFGQDVAVTPMYSGTVDESRTGTTSAALKLTSGDGAASIEIALGEPATPDDCAVGWVTPQSPFAPGAQVDWLSPDESTGQRFNVLAACGGELLVTGGGMLLTTYPENGSTLAAGLVNTDNLLGDDVWWTNLVVPTPDEAAFDHGGGGDITAALNVYPDGDRTAPPGYLSWTERPPRSSVGKAGSLDDICTAAP